MSLRCNTPCLDGSLITPGGIPPLIPAIFSSFWILLFVVNLQFLMGSSCFFLSALLGVILTLRAPAIGYGVPEHYRSDSPERTMPTREKAIREVALSLRRIDVWASVLQAIGSCIYFSHSICNVIPPAYLYHPRLAVYMLSAMASALYVVSNYLMVVEVVRVWLGWKPQSLGYWESVSNMLGGAGFLVASILGFWAPGRETLGIAGVYVSYLTGSIFFWLGSFMMQVDVIN